MVIEPSVVQSRSSCTVLCTFTHISMEHLPGRTNGQVLAIVHADARPRARLPFSKSCSTAPNGAGCCIFRLVCPQDGP